MFYRENQCVNAKEFHNQQSQVIMYFVAFSKPDKWSQSSLLTSLNNDNAEQVHCR